MRETVRCQARAKGRIFFSGAGIALAVSALLIREFYDDALYWPRSAEERIEEMAEILQRLGAPARWCYPSSHPHNIAQNARLRLGACLTQIAPLGPLYRTIPTRVCEAVLRRAHRLRDL